MEFFETFAWLICGLFLLVFLALVQQAFINRRTWRAVEQLTRKSVQWDKAVRPPAGSPAIPLAPLREMGPMTIGLGEKLARIQAGDPGQIHESIQDDPALPLWVRRDMKVCREIEDDMVRRGTFNRRWFSVQED